MRRNNLTNGPDARAYEIFVSYSHADRAIVTPIVDLFRSAGSRPFRDEQNIKPGTRWKTVVSAAIEDCRLMWVFWCRHSQVSREVRKEYMHAVALEKEVVPVLMDSTPLPKPLSEFQWIDMRSALSSHNYPGHVVRVPEAEVEWAVLHWQSSGIETREVEVVRDSDGMCTITVFVNPDRSEIEGAGARLHACSGVRPEAVL